MDILLEIMWLETLGIMQIDWKFMEMTFRHQDKLITLAGNPKLTRTPLSQAQLSKLSLVEYCLLLWESNFLEASVEFEYEVSVQQQQQLADFL